jgi:diacylglycerol kinase family enzyme
LRGALPALFDPTVYDLDLEIGGGDRRNERVVGAAFANARTAAGGIELAPRASCEDGLLDVVAIRDGTVVDFAALAARYVLADALKSEQVAFYRGRRLRVRSRPALPLSVDGEDLEPVAELELTVHPKVLRVVVGPEYEP